ncbi:MULTISPECIES: SDR family oxidoreductase [unclassified Isoptericola]|uniref:SDR family oxidoreductase n=1 Tax=unclassified Isoptericola TaxID=2623355 RepID=UPI0027127C85|nr:MULTISPECIES: SDR family oxidoreductase [unclassified Isoptericola]MDO8144290.1 SDR family oxidoreductase [Isoptericola sp. 178]MDO8148144.1 SDR family oxidoreductase [Isoptericola sp. b515]MDO8151621.1 SDR family oxidoreductase [Isoptericola sp. b408]
MASHAPRRVLVTDAEEFLGPAAVERFTAEGEDVTALSEPLGSRADLEAVVAAEGPFDVVVANLEAPITVAPVTAYDDAVVDELHARLVRPLYWIFATCLPSMLEAGRGWIVVPTSATALRTASNPIAGYESARAAQAALVRSVAWEVSGRGVRVNGIAPNFIENPSYFPPETVADPEFQEAVRREVPAQRLGGADEAAAALWWLASPESSYVMGSVIATDGGWSLG